MFGSTSKFDSRVHSRGLMRSGRDKSSFCQSYSAFGAWVTGSFEPCLRVDQGPHLDAISITGHLENAYRPTIVVKAHGRHATVA